MAVYAMSDLHLALSIDKPMDVFGSRWSNYMEKIIAGWKETVSYEDYVLVPGDISWATYLEQALEDFKYIDSLPGRKIISKGNHDYWWTTHNKLEQYVEKNNFSSIEFMHNNSFRVGNIVLCGTRGWKCPGDDEFSAEDEKVYRRELGRLDLSLKNAIISDNDRVVVALHYPPFNPKGEPSGFVDVMKRYGVALCIYGHLHGEGFKNAVEGELHGLTFKLVSADYLNFKPYKIT